MLVLTRKTKEKVSFPQVGITVHFVRIQAGQVRVGIDAPREIAIVRDELENAAATAELVRRQLLRIPRELRHGIRNELHQISIAMHLYRELAKSGNFEEAEEIFETLQESMKRLDENQILRRPESGTEVETDQNTVVLIEDEPNEREMLAGFLRLKGFNVITFEDGQDALEYLSDHEPPGIILLDMRMPRVDGPSTLETLRQTRRFDDTQIFAVSGSTSRENGVTVGKQGVNRWFSKPLNPESLVNAIENTFCANSAERVSVIASQLDSN